MARRLVVQPQAELDIQAAAVWYEDRRVGLGVRFLDELGLVFQRIETNPRQFPRLEADVRRALLSHFPYGVYFVEALVGWWVGLGFAVDYSRHGC